MQISVLKCLDQGGKITSTTTITKALKAIKNHPQREIILKAKNDPTLGGKYNPNKQYSDKVWDRQQRKMVVEKRNLYNHVKSTKIPVVTWCGTFDERRSKATINKLSGYIYFDVDDFELTKKKEGITTDEDARKYVWSIITNNGLKFIKAAWHSFGGQGFSKGGFGFLVKVNNLTLENFTSTWLALEKFFRDKYITLDAQTKDLTRSNVLSYDPEVFIRPDDENRSYEAVEPQRELLKTFERVEIPQGLQPDILAYKLQSLYESDSCWTNNRLNYHFYFNFFSSINHYGIDLDAAHQFLVENADNYEALFCHRTINQVDRIKQSVGSHYSDQNGMIQIHVDKDLPVIHRFTPMGIFREYQGNKLLKLESVWKNVTRKGGEKTPLLDKFLKIVKEQGIPKENTLDFLNDQMFLETEDLELVDFVYGSTLPYFGFVKEYTKEAINERKKRFAKRMEAKGRVIVKNDSFSGDIDKKLQEVYNSAYQIFGAPSKEVYFDFFRFIFKKTKELAISKGDALTSLESILSDGEQTSYAEFTAKEVYDYQPWMFGVSTKRVLTSEEVAKRFEFSEKYTLKKGQYISDLNLQIGDVSSKLIWGNTGQGKTTWICSEKHEYKLVLVPLVNLLEGIQSDYEASVYYNGAKNAKEGDKLIVCTYSSFPNLFRKMQKWEDVKIEDYHLLIDEDHNFAVSSDPFYRGYELNHIADNMHLFKSRTKLTGTPTPILHPAFKDFTYVRVEWENVPVKKCVPVIYKDIYYAVEKNLNRDKKNFIYLQNKRMEGKLGSLIDYLEMKGWSKDEMWIINADEKDGEAFQKLIKEKRVDDNIKILIATSVLGEGMDIKNSDFATVHFMTKESHIVMEQTVNRLRSVFTHNENPNCVIYNYYSQNSKERTDDHVDVVGLQEKLISQAKESLTKFKTAYLSGDSISNKITNKIFMQQIFGKSNLFRNKDGNWEVDYLGIANMAYKEEMKCACNDLDFLKTMLHVYNWEFSDPIYISQDVRDIEKEMMSKSRKMRKEELIDKVTTILDEIKSEGEKEMESLLDDANIHKLEKKEYSEYEIGLRSKIRYLCNNYSFESSIEIMQKWVVQHNMSERVWRKMTRQISVLVAKSLKVFDSCSDLNTKEAKKLLGVFKKLKGEKIITKAELKSIVSGVTQKKYTTLGGLSFMKQYFDVKEVLDKNKVKYKLIGLKIANDIATFTKDFEKWLTINFKKETKFTSEALCEKINKLRGQTALLGEFRLDSKKAMRLANDYVDIVKCSTWKKGERKVNVYKIESLKPSMLESYKLNPLRKVDNIRQDDLSKGYEEVIKKDLLETTLSYHKQMELL